MPCPRYLRVMTVLGDRDRDLREWCYHNRRARTAVIREALRAFLRERGELPQAADGSPARPVAKPVAARPPERAKQPVPSPAAGSAEPAATGPATTRPAAPAEPHQPDVRSSLRAMLGDFS